MSTAAAAAKAIVYQLDSKGRTLAVYDNIVTYATGTGITSYCVLADGRVMLKWPADVRQASTAELSREFGCQLEMYVAFFDEDPASAGWSEMVMCAGDFTEPRSNERLGRTSGEEEEGCRTGGGGSRERLGRKRVASEEEEEGCRTGGGGSRERQMPRRGMCTRSRQYTQLWSQPKCTRRRQQTSAAAASGLH